MFGASVGSAISKLDVIPLKSWRDYDSRSEVSAVKVAEDSFGPYVG